jgi:hypothetical protein
MTLTIITDSAKLNVDVENEDCNTIEIWNVDHWNIIILTDSQLDELKQYFEKME